jgi:hypothetical protein
LFEHAPARHRSYDRELAAALEHMPRYQPESALDCVRYWTAVREAYASAGFQTGVPARLSAISRWRSPQVESKGR